MMATKLPWKPNSEAYVFDQTCQPQVLPPFPFSLLPHDPATALPSTFEARGCRVSLMSCSADCYICSAGTKDTPPVTRFFWPAFKAFSFICCRSAPPATELRHTPHRTHTHRTHTTLSSVTPTTPLQPQTTTTTSEPSTP